MRDINRAVEITIVDEENKVIGAMPRNEVLEKGIHHRTIHILATFEGKLTLQRLSQKHIKSPNLIGSSAAGFLLKEENSDDAAKRIIKKELGIITDALIPITTIMMEEGIAKKFVSIYWFNLTVIPKQMPDEFSHLLQLRTEEVNALLSEIPSNFAKTFKPVFEAWKYFIEDLQNKVSHNLITDDKKSSKDCDALLEAYNAAIDEYRFQVSLTWERNRFFLVSGMTGISVAIAMMRFSDHVISVIMIPLFFTLSSCLALLGLSAQKVGKLYYRRTLDHLFEVIDLLNTEHTKRNSAYVPVPVFKTTKGMKSRGNANDNVDTSSKINSGSFSSYLRYFFILIAGTGGIGTISSVTYYAVHYKVIERIQLFIQDLLTP